MRVTNGIPLGCALLLPVSTVNSAQTLKANMASIHIPLFIDGRIATTLPDQRRGHFIDGSIGGIAGTVLSVVLLVSYIYIIEDLNIYYSIYF
jgi:hypothetical protein